MKEPAAGEQDARFMREALREARLAARAGEVPVGAVVAAGGRIVARGSNRPVRTADPTAHAEIVALRRAAKKRGNYRLTDCELYVTVEPCAMCLGAAIQARLRRIVFGADDPKAGAVRSVVRFPLEKTNHRMEITSGVLAGECADVLRAFFRKKRRKGL